MHDLLFYQSSASRTCESSHIMVLDKTEEMDGDRKNQGAAAVAYSTIKY